MPPKPTKDKPDETSIQANLQSILDRINVRVEVDPQAEIIDNHPTHFPELDRAEYFMGNVNFDPVYYLKSLYTTQPDEALLLHRYCYWTPDHGKAFFHKLYTKTEVASPDFCRRLWSSRAKDVMLTWKRAKTTIDRLDTRTFVPGALKLILGPEFEQKCDTWMAEIVNKVLLESEVPALLEMNPVKDKLRDMTRNAQATMPRSNRPDVGRYSEDHVRTHFVESNDPRKPWSKEGRILNGLPYFQSRLDVQDTSDLHKLGLEAGYKFESRTQSLKYHAHIWAPMLNIENLRQPGFMASLIYNRGAHHPALFASRDFESSYIGRAGRMDDTFHWYFNSDFWELRDDDRYVHPIQAPGVDPWQKAVVRDLQARGQLYSYLELGAIVHSQRIIYKFLEKLVSHIEVRTIQLILDNPVDALSMPPSFCIQQGPQGTERLIDELLKRDWDNLKTEGTDTSGDTKQVAHMWATRQYMPPEETVFDYDECEKMMLFMRDSARDKLNKMMTDPEVFLNEAKLILDHHPGQVKAPETKKKTRHFETGKVGKFGKAEADRLEDELSACVMHRMVLTAVRDLEIWEHLSTVAGRLAEYIRTEHIDLADPETQLTDELRKLWLLLLHSLRANFSHYYIDFQQNNPFLASPPIRDAATRHMRMKARKEADPRQQGIKDYPEHYWQIETKEGQNYREKKYTHRGKEDKSKVWEKDDCRLYCPDSYLMTSYRLKFDDETERLELMSEATKVKRLLYRALPVSQNLTFVGMSNIAEHLAKVNAELDPNDRMITPHVWNHISKLDILSRFVNDMERTRRTLPSQSQRLRQEFEEDYGELSKYVFGPARYLPELATSMFLPAGLRSGCMNLKGLLYPLLRRIDKGEDLGKGKDVDEGTGDAMVLDDETIENVPRENEDVNMDGVDDDGGVNFNEKGWDKVMKPENRRQELTGIWRQALIGIVGNGINDVFGSSNNKINKGIKKMSKQINNGEFGVGLARFLSTFDTGKVKPKTKQEADNIRKFAEDQEIQKLIAWIQKGSEDLERATREANGETTQDSEEATTTTPENTTATARAAPRVPRQRDPNSRYHRRMRRQQARQQGQGDQQQPGLIQDAPAPQADLAVAIPIVRQPLRDRHWQALAGTLGVRLHGALERTDFDAFLAAIVAIGYSWREGPGSTLRIGWTAHSNLPPPLGRRSFVVHRPHGAALENITIVMLRIGARLPNIGVTQERLALYYEGAPQWW